MADHTCSQDQSGRGVEERIACPITGSATETYANRVLPFDGTHFKEIIDILAVTCQAKTQK